MRQLHSNQLEGYEEVSGTPSSHKHRALLTLDKSNSALQAFDCIPAARQPQFSYVLKTVHPISPKMDQNGTWIKKHVT